MYLSVRTAYLKFFCRTALTEANFLISSVLSRAFATIFSVERMVSFVSLFWLILDRRYVLITFNLEKDRSALATVTGMVRNSTNNFWNCGNDDIILLLYISCNNSLTVFKSEISSLNSLTKDLVSVTKSFVKSSWYDFNITSTELSISSILAAFKLQGYRKLNTDDTKFCPAKRTRSSVSATSMVW